MDANPLEDVARHAAQVAGLRQQLHEELERRNRAIRAARDAGFRPSIIRQKAVVDGEPMSGSVYADIVR